MDLTPFATSVEGHSHIAMKIPCNNDGIAPNLKSLDVGKAINNGTLNGKNLDLSEKVIPVCSTPSYLLALLILHWSIAD